MWFLEGILPVFIVGIVFAVIAIIGVTIIIASMKKRKMEIDAYKAAVEKGIQVPEFKIARKPIRTLKAALIWLAVGIGFFIMMVAEGDNSGMSVSAIPVLIGIALIISYKVEKNAEKDEKRE